MRQFFYPLFEILGASDVYFDMIFNPYYPDRVKWRCKASRKFVRRRK